MAYTTMPPCTGWITAYYTPVDAGVAKIYGDPEHLHNLLGHLPPAGAIIGTAIYELTTHDINPQQMLHVQATVNVWVGGGYLLADALLLYAHWSPFYYPNFNFISGYSPREQQHLSVFTVILICGLMGRLHARHSAHAKHNLPVLLFAMSFGFFIAMHEQPNGTGVLLHGAAMSFVMLHALFRILQMKQPSAIFNMLGGSVLVYGQTGFAARYEYTRMFPTTALMYITAYTLMWAYIYMMIFPEPDLPQSGMMRGGMKESDDGRAAYSNLTANGEPDDEENPEESQGKFLEHVNGGGELGMNGGHGEDDGVEMEKW
eukprot:CAMPEP_0119469604 /NCGR_PEP_ID=MMETSP1344-20130328/2855_1 /TAXON_ID=236787 /ORGANISM="Florenciella parvula, Strain CCMP2471" /LENGTH=315 /DNA_ID=CAMNT_0007502179 /DNA_START=258 /DNA_END=1206 /DNA_ORIENTATION=-